MFCPKCGCPCEAHYHFCMHCGTPLNNSPEITAPSKKGSLWIPLLVMALMIAIGIAGFVLFPLDGTAEPAAQSDTPWFEVYDNTLYFYPELYTGGSELEVPAEIDGEQVLYLGPHCFSDCDELTTVILPEGLLLIDVYAFSDADSLRGIFIPTTVTSICYGAFADCDGLEAICISDTMEIIEEDVFLDCDNLRCLFFGGTLDEWTALYDGYISKNTRLYCDDGIFFQN